MDSRTEPVVRGPDRLYRDPVRLRVLLVLAGLHGLA